MSDAGEKKNDAGAPPFLGANGKFLTESLFWETSRDRTVNPPAFTLKGSEHEGCPSMKELYLQIGDPSEYEFAQRVLGSWQHWVTLTQLAWFKPHIEEWREELMARLRSKAAMVSIEVMSDPSAPAATKMQASRYVTTRGWEDQPTKGRPSKKQVNQEARAMAQKDRDLEEDYKRILN